MPLHTNTTRSPGAAVKASLARYVHHASPIQRYSRQLSARLWSGHAFARAQSSCTAPGTTAGTKRSGTAVSLVLEPTVQVRGCIAVMVGLQGDRIVKGGGDGQGGYGKHDPMG